MGSLSPKEQDLLVRYDQREDFRPLFLRRVRGLKWFDHLNQRGCFDPGTLPEPESTGEEGYVRIVAWPITDYLVKTAPELAGQTNLDFAKKFLNILVSATDHARQNKFTNHQTWCQFAQIIRHIPVNAIPTADLQIIDYWFDDKYETGLLAKEVGEAWLPELLEQGTSPAPALCGELLKCLYKVEFRDKQFTGTSLEEAVHRIAPHYINRITEKIARLAGKGMGAESVDIFHNSLKLILERLGNDAWSAIWHPAIEDHEQNQFRDRAENTVVKAYRESLQGYLETSPESAFKRVSEMLSDEHQTIKRIVIHAITENYFVCRNLLARLIAKEFLEENYRHEMWRCLDRHYARLSDKQKSRLLKLISGISRRDSDGKVLKAATAYAQANWLAAIREQGAEEKQLYQQRVAEAGTEPSHPNFSSFRTSGPFTRESDKLVEAFNGMNVDQVVEFLKGYYEDTPIRVGQGVQALSTAFRETVKTKPLKYYAHLRLFLECDTRHLGDLIDVFWEILSQEESLPRTEIWSELLGFCESLILREGFWNDGEQHRDLSVSAQRGRIVSSVAMLIEDGTSSDAAELRDEHLRIAERILRVLLERETGDKFARDCDAVTVTNNSLRGRALRSLICLALCRFRRSNDEIKARSSVWGEMESIFQSELQRARENNEYEFITLISKYLPQFSYMSKAWTQKSLGRIFDRRNRISWRCAMQGWMQSSTFLPEVFDFLKDGGHLFQALDDDDLRPRILEGTIYRICDAFRMGYEDLSDEGSMIKVLVLRMRPDELGHAIWHVEGWESKHRTKVLALWSEVSNRLDFSYAEHRRLASYLCTWVDFIEKIDDTNRHLIRCVAPYAEVNHRSYQLLEFMARISDFQPFEAANIWIDLLTESTPVYPQDALQKILLNLCEIGQKGIRRAKEIVSRYLQAGIEGPDKILLKITKQASLNGLQ